MTAEDLRRLNLVDTVIAEPLGGAHRDAAATIRSVGDVVGEVLAQLVTMDWSVVKARRQEKFLAMGAPAA